MGCFASKSIHSFNPATGKEGLILRGIRECEDVDEPNYRVYCCRTNNCNKYLPPMNTRTLADSMPLGEEDVSSERRLTASVLVIASFFVVRHLLF